MLDENIIESSYSPYSSPIWIVPKKIDSSGQRKWRLVIDYRNLNSITVGDSYPLPLIDNILDQLGHSVYFSTLDLASGFHQMEMADIKPPPVHTYASKDAIGAVLSQDYDGKDLPICYHSRTLNKAETNYSVIERELLAIVGACQKFRPYLYGRSFRIVTDHQPLIYLHKYKDPSSRLVRWRLKPMDFEYEIMYKKGTLNSNADALSRIVYQNNDPEKTHCIIQLEGEDLTFDNFKGFYQS